MSFQLTPEAVAKILKQNLLKNVEDAFYEQLRPQLDNIARNTAKNLARSLKSHITVSSNFEYGHSTAVTLTFNSEELDF